MLAKFKENARILKKIKVYRGRDEIMATAKKTSYETKRYANLIPMKEIQSVQDQLFPFTIYNTLRKKHR